MNSFRRLIQLVDSIQKRSLALKPDEHVALRMLANSVIQAADLAVQVRFYQVAKQAEVDMC
jgi:hypothetical protein